MSRKERPTFIVTLPLDTSPGHEDSYDAAGLPHHHWQTLTIALPDA
jgi:hypothetical protein